MCVWPPCCDVLRHVGCCWLKFEDGQIWANNTQHVTTWWPNAHNMLHPTMLRYVTLPCCDRLARACFIRDFFYLYQNLLTHTALYCCRLVTLASSRGRLVGNKENSTGLNVVVCIIFLNCIYFSNEKLSWSIPNDSKYFKSLWNLVTGMVKLIMRYQLAFRNWNVSFSKRYERKFRLDYQPLFGKGARTNDTRERRKSSLMEILSFKNRVT